MSDAPEVSRCPVCAGEVGEAEVLACPRCETPHHKECWDYVGGCAIFGCRPAADGARLPVAREDRQEVEDLARWYTGLFRAHWWGFLAMALPTAWAPVLFFLAFLLRADVVALAIPVFMLLGAASYFLLLLPLLGTRWLLQRRLGVPLQAPRGGAPGLLESMEMSRGGGLLLAIVQHGPLVYLMLMVVAALVGGGVAPVLWSFFALPLLIGVRHATRQRVLMIEALQNRLLASLKKG